MPPMYLSTSYSTCTSQHGCCAREAKNPKMWARINCGSRKNFPLKLLRFMLIVVYLLLYYICTYFSAAETFTETCSARFNSRRELYFYEQKVQRFIIKCVKERWTSLLGVNFRNFCCPNRVRMKFQLRNMYQNVT